MDLRKVTRNPGWWRLFIVLAGLWYGGWLVVGVVMFSEEIFNREPVGNDHLVAHETYEIMDVTRRTELELLDEEIARLKARIGLIPPPKPWYRDIDVLGTIAAIILFPWLVFFNLRLMRYVIEGFILERE